MIAVTAGLAPAARRTAIEAGPPEVDAESDYASLVEAAGFTRVVGVDVTDEYLATLEAWLREWDAEAAALVDLVGRDEFDERQSNRRRAIEAVRAGLLERYIITGQRP